MKHQAEQRLLVKISLALVTIRKPTPAQADCNVTEWPQNPDQASNILLQPLLSCSDIRKDTWISWHPVSSSEEMKKSCIFLHLLYFVRLNWDVYDSNLVRSTLQHSMKHKNGDKRVPAGSTGRNLNLHIKTLMWAAKEQRQNQLILSARAFLELRGTAHVHVWGVMQLRCAVQQPKYAASVSDGPKWIL